VNITPGDHLKSKSRGRSSTRKGRYAIASDGPTAPLDRLPLTLFVSDYQVDSLEKWSLFHAGHMQIRAWFK
jgi:hypothetical protein